MKIDYLCNQSGHVETVSRWIYDEFVVGSGSKSTMEILVDYFGKTGVNTYPITFVAFNDKGCVGTVSIFENDLKTQDELKPWLASLYVKPQCRGQGIAEKLIEAVIDKTKKLGHANLYLRTEHTADYYKSRGWSLVYESTDEKGQDTEVYKYVIK